MRLDLRRRPFLSIALVGVASVLLVAAIGRVAEWWRLGDTDLATYAHVERQVRRQFEQMSTSLETGAARLAERAVPVLRASPDDRDLGPLFEEAAAVTRGEAGGLAATVYGLDDTPLAWSGPPSQAERWPAGNALFVAPGALGLRLVRTQPVIADGARVGMVALERLFAEQQPAGSLPGRRFTIQTPLATVGLRIPSDGAAERSVPFRFLIRSAGGEPLLEAAVDPASLALARSEHRRGVHALILVGLALTALLLAGPLLDRRAFTRTPGGQGLATLGVAGLLLLARAILWAATPVSERWLLLFPQAAGETSLVDGSEQLAVWFRHPLDFLLSSLLILGLVALFATPLERWRLRWRGRRRPVGGSAWRFTAAQAVPGAVLAAAVLGYQRFLADTFSSAGVDLLYFSPLPWNAARVAIALSLVLFNAALAWAVVLALRAGLAPWRFRWLEPRVGLLLLVAWGVPSAVVFGGAVTRGLSQQGGAVVCAALGVAAFVAPRGLAKLRHASQGYRLTAMFVALFLPAVLVYPSMVHYEDVARRRLVETLLQTEVMHQRENLQRRLLAAQQEIDGRPDVLESLVLASAPPSSASVPTESAFVIWQDTALERYRVSSAVELYNAAGMLVSRFALNLPEEANRQLWHEESCDWQTFGEISRFGARERQLLHAGRNVCGEKGILGTIVIHVILDDSSLSFLSTQNPYFELLRGGLPRPREDAPGRDLQYVVYGWSRTPIYVSGGGVAWGIEPELFEPIYGSRAPFWTRLVADGGHYEVLIGNDRRAIYALGYPAIAPIGHFINLAELMVLAGVGYLALLAGSTAFRSLSLRRPTSARHLLREIRESFYRKLFLAFVAASVIPVLTLALVTRAYIADRLRHDVEAAAHKTTAIARQVIEESLAAQDTAGILRDDFMVTLEAVVGQDVNVYAGPRLVATSERDLFASGLLPTRTPADVYRAIVLERMPTVITEEEAGDFRYMVAAAPVNVGWREALLTVPLTLRQQEIEREIRDLNRRIVLAAMLFILVGAAVGYPLAERIADPVNRLMRATRRLSRGDFDVRIATSASDELRRLVEAFNRMSAELQRQRVELERTHRLEAWAEMARQVAHEIKNPLTPIQLSAEHLRRVHLDRGRPLEPVLEGCVDSILSQVRLLRQIASEFSSFASTPSARRAPASLHDLVEEVVRPYVTGAGERVAFQVDVPAELPILSLDRTLVGRALTNVIDNALHAMPGEGTLSISGWEAGGTVALRIEDNGVGMDEEAQQRLFEPYFSTKAVGTGLGLSIARRNIELNGGTIAVSSEKGHGTTVTITFPIGNSSS